MRDNTERPVTISHGTNTLIGRDPKMLVETANARLDAPNAKCSIPGLWDGYTSDRIAAVISGWLN